MKPYPPRICTASPATRTATSLAKSLAMLASFVKRRLRSASQAARKTRSRAASIWVAMSASLIWVAWNSLIAFPNCLRRVA